VTNVPSYDRSKLHSLCAFCHNPIDPQDRYIAVIPKAQAHAQCYSHLCNAGTVWDVCNAVPCCDCKRVVLSLGGHLMTGRPQIPPNEVWFAEVVDGRRVITGYVIRPDGILEPIKDPRKTLPTELPRAEVSPNA
jgi:hypothetical protein